MNVSIEYLQVNNIIYNEDYPFGLKIIHIVGNYMIMRIQDSTLHFPTFGISFNEVINNESFSTEPYKITTG